MLSVLSHKQRPITRYALSTVYLNPTSNKPFQNLDTIKLKELAQELEISDNLTTYVARHSFATILKRSGVDIALISELMGHSDLTTTQIYLDSFDEEQINTAMQHLV